MNDKNYRDVKAIVKLLTNRDQNDLSQMIIDFLLSKNIISKEQATEVSNITNWAGSFWFFAENKYDLICSRCEKDCHKQKPVCLTFDNKPFCVRCLTEDEKANPNDAYTRFIKNNSGKTVARPKMGKRTYIK